MDFINQRTSDGETAVMVACKRQAECTDSLEVIETLLSIGADPNIPDNDGQSPLMIAIRDDKIKTIKILLKYHATITPETLKLAEGKPAVLELLPVD